MFFERHVHEDAELPIYFNHQLWNFKTHNEYHWHETSEWILVTEGSVEIRIGDTINHYQKGDLVLINPQLPHSFFSNGTCGYYCMIPDNSVLVAGGIDLHDFYTEALINDEEIKSYYRRIIAEFSEKGDYYKTCIKTYMVAMAALALRRFRKAGTASHLLGDNAMRITKDAIQYMEEHYAEEFSGEDLAQELGFSRSYLCHVIRKVTGQSLTENLLYIRCRKAREFLRRGVPVGEVVFMVGFKNASYFCRTYKRLLGASPSAHLKK